MLHYDLQHKLMRAYQPSRWGPILSYIWFTDDCLLITRAMIKDAAYLKVVVDTYHTISGQAVNLSKFQLMISSKVQSISKIKLESRLKCILSLKCGDI